MRDRQNSYDAYMRERASLYSRRRNSNEQNEIMREIMRRMVEERLLDDRTDPFRSERSLSDRSNQFLDAHSEPSVNNEPVQMKLCDVCYTESDAKTFFGLNCNHVFCRGCMEDHLKAKVMDGNVEDIPFL